MVQKLDDAALGEIDRIFRDTIKDPVGHPQNRRVPTECPV